MNDDVFLSSSASINSAVECSCAVTSALVFDRDDRDDRDNAEQR